MALARPRDLYTDSDVVPFVEGDCDEARRLDSDGPGVHLDNPIASHGRLGEHFEEAGLAPLVGIVEQLEAGILRVHRDIAVEAVNIAEPTLGNYGLVFVRVNPALFHLPLVGHIPIPGTRFCR